MRINNKYKTEANIGFPRLVGTMPSNIFRVDEVPQRCIDLLELADVSKYWVNYEILGTLFDLDSHAVMKEANIEVGRLSYWLFILRELSKRVCISFREWFISFYEFLFTPINLWLPLIEFEEEVLKFVKIVPSQFHPSTSDLIRSFQL